MLIQMHETENLFTFLIPLLFFYNLHTEKKERHKILPTEPTGFVVHTQQQKHAQNINLSPKFS